jgi:hypothetical protein
MALGIRLAGFDIRDSIAWLYGSGFPKSLDVSKAIDKVAGATRTEGAREWSGGQRSAGILGVNHGTQTRTIHDAPATPAAQQWAGWGTALKPAFEPIVVARKPLVGTVAANVLEWGTGALNVDGCRVGVPEDKRAAGSRRYISGGKEPGALGGEIHAAPHDGLGRWPANVLLDGDAAAELDEQSGTLKSGGFAGTVQRPRGGQTSKGDEAVRVREDREPDSGGASRFFPTFRYQAKAPTRERVKVGDVAHPTVKPLALMRWLVRLVTPPGGVVLDPFAGSGTTIEAAILEGFQVIGIEREADYLPLIEARIARNRITAEGLPEVADALALFDIEEPA